MISSMPWKWVFGERQFTGNDKLVVLCILSHQNPSTGCYAWEKTIAKECGISERSVRTTITRLKKYPGVTVKRERRGNRIWISQEQLLIFSKCNVSATGTSCRSDVRTGTSCRSQPAPVAVPNRHQLPVGREVLGIEVKGKEKSKTPGRIVDCPERQQFMMFFREMAGKKTMP